ncbi:M48 family metallopeptidase [Crocosphaera sp. XPORK-15E]|uniref:M48 family metallopeptidase n=1 Tax=Crocosphaera sp. XPORK-15E TaxID=3110247 RepID=UPI002B2136B4|nr:M48 family metallopeptidase [Crocosphaera sp. XPORK-15E]MEA5536608.1 M48 family metallopeptidase [Crocosphaera sp. XPORK-15E]
MAILFLPNILRSTATDLERLEGELLDQLKSSKSISIESIPRVKEILDELYHISNSKLSQYTQYVLDSDQINAMALPSGIILLTKGFVDILEDFSDDEIAGVLAHEIGHIELGHAKSRMEDEFRLNVIESAASLVLRNPLVNLTVSGMSFLSQQMFSREHEYEADNYALSLLSNSEYSPVGLIKALQKLSKGDTIPQWLEILSTHPHLDERVSNLIKQV